MRDSQWGFPIIDFHCHFPVPDDMMADADNAYIAANGQDKFDALRRDWRWYQDQWWAAYSFDPPEDDESPAALQGQRWADEVEQAALERIVFVTGGGNETLAEIVAARPERFVGFAHHSPFALDAADRLRRAVTVLGLRGYKILAPALLGRIDDDALRPVWQVAEDLQIPVLIHFGVLDGGGGTAHHRNIDPLQLHDVAKAYPYTTFVIPHFGCGYPGELLRLMWACRNVLVDTSGNNEWVRWMPFQLTLADLFRKFFETVGPDRIVFGSDSAHFPRGLVHTYYEEQIRICSQLGLSDEERNLVFAGNAHRLLGLQENGVTT